MKYGTDFLTKRSGGVLRFSLYLVRIVGWVTPSAKLLARSALWVTELGYITGFS